jgi:dolichyl-phosphate beta-glucosyltransferase
MPVELSLVVPAYNEATRLPPYLATIRPYLRGSFGDHHEVLVVDDGSDDALADHLRPLTTDWPQCAVLRHEHNRGKGAAIRTGIAASRGQLVLFADADGATPIAEERKLRHAVAEGAALAVGSRHLHAEGTTRERVWHRRLGGRLFARLAGLLLGLPISDTQCGFKMLRGDVGRQLADLCREPGYLFDLELLLWARRLGYPVAEVAVCWREIPGSKLRLARDGPALLWGLWKLRRRAEAGGPLAEECPQRAGGPHAPLSAGLAPSVRLPQ